MNRIIAVDYGEYCKSAERGRDDKKYPTTKAEKRRKIE